MRAGRLLALWDRVADAPGAAARLRRLVLDLAVRGRLVAQDAGDEPASTLLERIAAERARLVRAGEVREPRDVVRVPRHALPFAPPDRWGWARLIDIAQPQYGFAFPSGQFNGERRGMPLIRIRDISKPDTEAYFEGSYDPVYLVKAGDYLVGMDGDFNLRRWEGQNALLNQRVMRINGWRCEVDPEFMALPLQMVLDQLHGSTSLTTVKHLSAKQVNGIEVPLPPLAEQGRIVARVGELMGLLDRLEAARAAREAVRDRLAAASLTRLAAPDQDAEASRDHALHALAALPTLMARPDQVQALRRTILDLAVRGRLVDQEPEDEPAEKLLRRSRHRRVSRSSSDGQINAGKNIFPLPGGWIWAALDDLIIFGPQNGRSPRPSERPDAPLAITLTATSRGVFDSSHYKRVEAHPSADSDLWLKPNDLLFQRGNTRDYVGMAAIYNGPPNLYLFPDLIIRVRLTDEVCLRYVHMFCISPHGRRYLSENATGAQQSMPKINQDILRAMPVAVPPLAEQRRIVARVDALLALCDRLEAALALAGAARTRLLDALIRDALDPAAMLLEAAE